MKVNLEMFENNFPYSNNLFIFSHHFKVAMGNIANEKNYSQSSPVDFQLTLHLRSGLLCLQLELYSVLDLARHLRSGSLCLQLELYAVLVLVVHQDVSLHGVLKSIDTQDTVG